jgi:CRP/FNR family transcriptional regulator, cyclic AMP receptor protein
VTSFFDYPGDLPNELGATFLASATDDDWAEIRAHGEVRRHRAGETVIAGGQADRSLYVVLSGRLEAVMAQGRRRQRRVTVMDTGTVVGEVGFLDGLPRSATVRALDDVELLRLPFGAFEALAAKNPALGRAILLDLGRILAMRLRTVESLLP